MKKVETDILEKEFLEVRIYLIIHHPFWGRLVGNIAQQFTNEVSNIAVTANINQIIILKINKTYWQTLKKSDRTETLAIRTQAIKNVLLDWCIELFKISRAPEWPISTISSEGFLFIKKQLNQLSTTDQALLKRNIYSFFKRNAKTLIINHEQNIEGLLWSKIKTSFEQPRSGQNWRNTLNFFSKTSGQTLLKSTLKKSSKRYRTIPGTKIRSTSRLLVAIDTSGSIADHDYHFSEIHKLWRNQIECEIIEVDDRIRKCYSYRGVTPTIRTRGGTDFSPAIQYANQQRAIDGLIYFTDGFGPVPGIPSKSPILWIISSTGITPSTYQWSALQGRKVKMNLKA